MPSMVRPSSAEIDRAILDAAAEVFAVTGFAGTSVQKVADTVGYSKTGLLHRFPSKQALYGAVVAEVRAVVSELVDEAARLPAGPRRTPATVTLVARFAFARPGLLRLLVESMRPASTDPGRAELEALGLQVVAALAPGDQDPVRRLRLLLGLNLVAEAVLCSAADPEGLEPAQVQALAVELATAVLGPS